MRSKLKKGNVFGEWELVSLLGKGGNGEVWKASKGSEYYAIKFLHSAKEITQKKYQRFKNEIDAITKNQGVDGIIPILERNLPDDRHASIPWYVMPVALSYEGWREQKSIDEVICEFIKLGEAIEKLHKNGFSHRDIKPANILFLNEKLLLSDFGLAKEEDGEDITQKHEDIGPKFTLAPEMKRQASQADGKCADVYSFAKTLWIAITRDPMCFEGQYSLHDKTNVEKFFSGRYVTQLHKLLSACTDHYPQERPQMSSVVYRLKEWVKKDKSFNDKNLAQWYDLQEMLFPVVIPSRTQWKSIDDIIAVLKAVLRFDQLNHLFYPDGGGQTFIDIDKGYDDNSVEDLIEIKIEEKMVELIKPKKLTFESFDKNPMWNYFRLEADYLEPTGLMKGFDTCSYEQIVELEHGNYISSRHWDEDEYNGEPLPDHARKVRRFYKGSFVIFSKASVWNKIPDSYNKEYNQLSENEFNDLISKLAIAHEKIEKQHCKTGMFSHSSPYKEPTIF